jgi:hypothetical protein
MKSLPLHFTQAEGAIELQKMVLHDSAIAQMSYTIDSSPPSAEAQVYHSNNLDDIFGSDDELEGNERQEVGNTEWSDIPRLKEKHETEGYRDGVGKGKAQTVQGGFDEGYTLGAVLGLRVGKIVGLLEGILAGAKAVVITDGAQVEWKNEKERLEKLVVVARHELKTQSVFGAEWWGEDGIWKFEVEGEGEGKEVLFPDVANAHPLIRKWEGVVEEEMQRWELDVGVMERENENEEKRAETKEALARQDGGTSKTLGGTKELSW